MNENKMIDKVRALLAKAEATDYPEEAKSFTAKAVELMENHAIDEAELRDATTTVSPFIDRKIDIPNPYVRPKTNLFNAIAKANRCRVISLNGGSHQIHVFGRESDIELVELIYTSLLVQQAREMYAIDYKGRDVRSWRRSFIVGYASEINRRMSEAKRKADTDADGNIRHGALVLFEDAKAVETKVRETYPTLTTSKISIRSMSGLMAGRRAGSRASFGGNQISGNRRSITS